VSIVLSIKLCRLTVASLGSTAAGESPYVDDFVTGTDEIKLGFFVDSAKVIQGRWYVLVGRLRVVPSVGCFEFWGLPFPV